MIHFMNLIHLVYNFLWGDLITIPLPGGSSLCKCCVQPH